MKDFRTILAMRGRLFMDGGLGTMLQGAGMEPGMSPEMFGLEHPEKVIAVHKAYIDAGANVITTDTFGGSRTKLPSGVNVTEVNERLAGCAREAARGTDVFVAGSVGPLGIFLKPLGPMDFREMVAIFREQIRGLARGGADSILAETQFDLAEARAIVIAAREECDLPIGVSMTFENGVSLTGTSPEVFCETMLNMGVDFLGSNCGAGPDEMIGVARRLKKISTVPVFAQPNAGLPELEDGRTVFRLAPEAFARKMILFAEDGINILGGCCGTTPAHIAAMIRTLEGIPLRERKAENFEGIVLTSRSSCVRIGRGAAVQIIGERINPTGKKALAAELQASQFGKALAFAEEQTADGAEILDVNVGAPLVDESVLLPELVERLVSATSAVLCLDSSNPQALLAALEAYPASALVNSINGDEGRMEQLGPLCRLYGAPFVLLPIKGHSLPLKAAQRIAIIEELLKKAQEMGIPRRLIMIDVLALAVSSNPDAARECLATIRHCADVLHLPTTIGLSNISFGLPARELLNATFLPMAAAAGLSSFIGNPGARRIREALFSVHVLQGDDAHAEKFISRYAGWSPGKDGAGESARAGAAAGSAGTLEECIVQGKRDQVAELVRKELADGANPFALVRDKMIPAITEVGKKYERREYFLPQLLRSAETMQAAFALVKPLLEMDPAAGARPVMVLATVEGDIHDIGKNIVALMLSNHGFEIVDLGKDVKAEDIVDAAQKCGASLIGLSALMTTTMVKMEETTRLVAERKLDIPVMVGGAVVTREYARSIGAHYSGDAVDCVRVARELMKDAGN